MPARGHHACAFGATLEEQFELAAPFLKAGLARGEKACYLAHETDLRMVEKQLNARGVPLLGPRRPGVELRTCEQTGLAKLPFSPKGLISRWEKAVDAALAEGHAGLRVVVEMTWAVDGGLERLAEYEARSAELFETRPISALCLYNRLRFSQTVLRDAVLTHPDLDVHGEIAGNPDYLPCDAFLARLGDKRLSASSKPARSGRPGPSKG